MDDESGAVTAGDALAGPLAAAARFARSPWAIVLVGAWAFGEAIIVPIVPDVALGLFAFAAPRRAGPLFAAVLAGAVVGSLLLGALASAAPREVNAVLLSLPGIDEATFATVDARLDEAGVIGFAQFGPGPPLKVYTTEWIERDGGDPALVIGVALNRLTRIGPVVLVAVAAGLLLAGWLPHHQRLVIGAYVAAWTGFYAVYWTVA